jgi:hypothetical protein
MTGSRFREVPQTVDPRGRRSLNAGDSAASSLETAAVDPQMLSKAAVLDMQRSIGNRATARLLTVERGKGPIEEDKPLKGSDLAVQRGWLKANVLKLLGRGRNSQNVTVAPIVTAKDLGRGGFSWKVWFSIPSPATQDGWMIQEIVADAKITEGDGTKRTESYHFWEAWEVKQGKTVTIYQDQALDDNDDIYYTPSRKAGSKGVDKTVGKVKFYEGPLPSDFKTNNPSTVAGILNSSATEPPYWDGSGAAHNLTCKWDDSVPPGTSQIDTKP